MVCAGTELTGIFYNCIKGSDMQQLQLKISGLLVLALFGFQAQAGGNSDYPAAYFEPIITYQDPELVLSDANAAELQATVDDSQEESESSSAGAGKDDRYPAAYFEPVIVFQDLDAINKMPASNPKPASKAKKVRLSGSNKPGVSTAGSSFPFLGLLIVAALFGFIYWSVSKEKTSQNSDVAGGVEESDAAESDEDGISEPAETEESGASETVG